MNIMICSIFIFSRDFEQIEPLDAKWLKVAQNFYWTSRHSETHLVTKNMAPPDANWCFSYMLSCSTVIPF